MLRFAYCGRQAGARAARGHAALVFRRGTARLTLNSTAQWRLHRKSGLTSLGRATATPRSRSRRSSRTTSSTCSSKPMTRRPSKSASATTLRALACFRTALRIATGGTLLVNYDPYTSSLLRMSSDLGLAQYGGGTDYSHVAAGAVAREVPVELRTLDSLELLADGTVPPPNVMLLDTQGSELQIMHGGHAMISEHTVAIQTEAEFTPGLRRPAAVRRPLRVAGRSRFFLRRLS